jgi:hypothetical protein
MASRVTRLGEILPFGFYIVNLTKTWLGDFLGDFSLSLGDFFTKTSGHPDGQGKYYKTYLFRNLQTFIIS